MDLSDLSDLSMLSLMNDEILEGQILTAVSSTAYSHESPVSQDFDYLSPIQVSEQYDNRTIIKQLLCMASTDEQFDNVVAMMKEQKESAFDNDCVVLVEHPVQLAKYLNISCVCSDDLTEMLSRCIESDQNWAEESFDILAVELEAFSIDAVCELRLLPIRKLDLYARAKQLKLQDSYYEYRCNGETYNYKYQSPLDKAQRGEYVSYRDIYHLLMYGDTTQRQQIYVYLDFNPSMESLYAIYDFYLLPHSTSLQLLKNTIANDV